MLTRLPLFAAAAIEREEGQGWQVRQEGEGQATAENASCSEPAATGRTR